MRARKRNRLMAKRTGLVGAYDEMNSIYSMLKSISAGDIGEIIEQLKKAHCKEKRMNRLYWEMLRPIWFIRHVRQRYQWKRDGRPMVHYDGFQCGCCGRWHDIPFEIPQYESVGEWWDTVGLCPEGTGCCLDTVETHESENEQNPN